MRVLRVIYAYDISTKVSYTGQFCTYLVETTRSAYENLQTLYVWKNVKNSILKCETDDLMIKLLFAHKNK